MNIIKLAKLTFTMIVLLGASASATACTCGYLGVFENYSNTKPIVVHATVERFGEKLHGSSDYYKTMTIRIMEVYKGAFPHPTVSLMGDRGRDCRSYIDSEQLEIDGEYLFALAGTDQSQEFGGCGESFVKIEGPVISGNGFRDGTWGPYSSNLEDLLSKIRR